MRSFRLLLLVAGLSFAGAAVADTTITIHSTAVPAKGLETVHVSRAAIPGKPAEIWKAAEINPDCTEAGALEFRLTKAPEHGKVEIKSEPAFMSFPASNPRAACNQRKVPAHEVVYTAAAGYSGSDSAVVEAIRPEGLIRELNFRIAVR